MRVAVSASLALLAAPPLEPIRPERPPASLRLERRGTELRGLVRQGDEDWREVGRVRLPGPSELHVGVAGVNTSRSHLRVTFRGFRVTKLD
jgi:regulation of enolase protein 1 (concanavalin A-like superfamily)